MLDRAPPKSAISWPNGPKAVTVFVPGKGLAVLEGKPLQLWQAIQAGESRESLVGLFRKLFKVNEHVAQQEIEEFRGSLSP
jgi:hypothetical protein